MPALSSCSRECETHLALSSQGVVRNGDKAFLAVRDHGSGVDPQDRDRIFRRFERATNPRNVSGLGLGLFISRQIVEAHGGRLTVEGAQGGGARFVVALPLR